MVGPAQTGFMSSQLGDDGSPKTITTQSWTSMPLFIRERVPLNDVETHEERIAPASGEQPELPARVPRPPKDVRAAADADGPDGARLLRDDAGSD
jgi:hypothetical protein